MGAETVGKNNEPHKPQFATIIIYILVKPKKPKKQSEENEFS